MQCQPSGFQDAFQPGPELGAPPIDPHRSIERLQATIDRLEADLIATQRLATLGSMGAMVAHEINNLMTPILARAEFALSTGSPADMRRTVERSKVHVQRAISVTERLLGLANPEESPREACSVAGAVQEAIEAAMRPFEKDGIELIVAIPEDLHVAAQFDLLQQVLLNLLLNARQAMEGVRGRLRISARQEDEHVLIDICDAGKGIFPERLDGVINPFLAAPHAADAHSWQSVGLGLNVCRIIAQQHGATITAFANDGTGCTFQLRWPAAPAEHRLKS